MGVPEIGEYIGKHFHAD